MTGQQVIRKRIDQALRKIDGAKWELCPSDPALIRINGAPAIACDSPELLAYLLTVQPRKIREILKEKQ